MRVTGIKRIHGVGAKGPYDFAELFVLSKIETGKFGAATIEGGGEEPVGMEVAPEAVAQFDGVAYPAELALKTEPRNVRGEWKTCCVGVDRVAKSAVKAA